MGKVEANKLVKKNTLLATAFDLFREKGFAKTTISEIVQRAGLAKGTFYLYFKDKYDLRDRLIIYKTSQLFSGAHMELLNNSYDSFEEVMLAVADYVIRIFSEDKGLLMFITKNLSWGVFRSAFETTVPEESMRFYDYYLELLNQYSFHCSNPELMLFTILELVGSTTCSCILYEQPVTIEAYLPHLHRTLIHILDAFRI